MKRSRFTEEQIVGILLQFEAAVRVDADRFAFLGTSHVKGFHP